MVDGNDKCPVLGFSYGYTGERHEEAEPERTAQEDSSSSMDSSKTRAVDVLGCEPLAASHDSGDPDWGDVLHVAAQRPTLAFLDGERCCLVVRTANDFPRLVGEVCALEAAKEGILSRLSLLLRRLAEDITTEVVASNDTAAGLLYGKAVMGWDRSPPVSPLPNDLALHFDRTGQNCLTARGVDSFLDGSLVHKSTIASLSPLSNSFANRRPCHI